MKNIVYFCLGVVFGIVSSRMLGLPLWLELIIVLVIVGGIYLFDKKLGKK